MSGPGLCQQVERFSFERTHDIDLIRRIATDPHVWSGISDDFSGDPEKWIPPDPKVGWYMVAREKNELLGLWMFVPHSHVCWEVHTCLLPIAYGSTATAAAAAMAEWIFRHTTCERIVTNVPEYNRIALRFAERCGLTQYGFNPQSYRKDGRLWGQYLLGMSKCH